MIELYRRDVSGGREISKPGDPRRRGGLRVRAGSQPLWGSLPVPQLAAKILRGANGHSSVDVEAMACNEDERSVARCDGQ